jgi:hypothetical protein
MKQTWWQYRDWRFHPDMNGDGLVDAADLALWGQWLFFLPGDALIARFGATKLGQMLGLTPASFGTDTAAMISAAFWVLAVLAVLYLPSFLIDAWDPTRSQQRREQREALGRAHRERLARERLLRRQRFTRRFFGLASRPAKSASRSEPKLYEERPALPAPGAEHVGKALQRIDRAALYPHAGRESHPVDVRPSQIEEPGGGRAGFRAHG